MNRARLKTMIEKQFEVVSKGLDEELERMAQDDDVSLQEFVLKKELFEGSTDDLKEAIEHLFDLLDRQNGNKNRRFS